MKILFIVLCSLMFFCSCRGDKTEDGDTGGGQAGTNQADAEGSVEQKPTYYTMTVNLEGADKVENSQVHFSLKKDGRVIKKTLSDLKTGVCVQLKEEDFPYLQISISRGGELEYNCSTDKENKCPAEPNNWVFTYEQDCGWIRCSYEVKGFALAEGGRATGCLVMEDTVVPSA